MFNSSLIEHGHSPRNMEWNVLEDHISDEVKRAYDAAGETNVRGYSFSHKEHADQVVVVLINFNLWDTAVVDVNVKSDGAVGGDYKYYDEYHVVGVGGDGLQTKTVAVNGESLLYSNGTFPTWKAVSGDGTVAMAPKSIAFIHAHSSAA